MESERAVRTRAVIGMDWLQKRRLRYKRHSTVTLLEEVRERLKTGDIILFHKTTRSGMMDVLELDLLAPLFFRETEFRHSGIIIRRGDNLFVLECADELHSGHTLAIYPAGGKGIREVPLEPLLEAYTRDNGDPHFGVRFVGSEIPEDVLMSIVQSVGPKSYLKAKRSVPIYLSQYVLPAPALKKVIDMHSHQMMCSEFVHCVLSSCGALREFPSKLFAPYILENAHLFERYDIAGYSDVVRFTYSRPG